MLQWMFGNDSVACYKNACTWALMWACTFLDASWRALGRLQSVAIMASGQPATPILLDHTQAFLDGCPSWSAIRRPCQQHDCAEFCSTALHGMSGVVWGYFAESCLSDEPHLHALHSPLMLPLPVTASSDITLQALFISWHEEQGRLQALCAAYDVLCVQFSRSNEDSTKHPAAVNCEDGFVHVPVFQADGASIRWNLYDVRAAVRHRGPDATCGHFQALLHDAADVWIADDNQRPVRGCATDLHQPDVYMLCITRRDSSVVELPQRVDTSLEPTVVEDHVDNARDWKDVIGAFF